MNKNKNKSPNNDDKKNNNTAGGGGGDLTEFSKNIGNLPLKSTNKDPLHELGIFLSVTYFFK